MKLLPAVFCFAVVFPFFAVGQQSIQSICNSIKGAYQCNAIITLPTTAVVKQCRNKIFEVRTLRRLLYSC